MATITKHLYICVGLLIVAVVGGLWWHAKIVADAGAQKAVQVVAAQTDSTVKAGSAEIAAASAAQAASDKQTAALIAALNAQKQQPVAPVDYGLINQMIASQVKVAPAAVTTKADATGTAQTTLPTVALRNDMLTDQQDTAELQNAKAAQQTLETKLDAETADAAAYQSQAAADELVIKGGTLKHRTAVALKHIGCTTAGMVAGYATSRTSASDGASAIAGGSTFGACEYALRKK